MSEVGHEAGAALSLIELDLATSIGDAWVAAHEEIAAQKGDTRTEGANARASARAGGGDGERVEGERALPSLAAQHDQGTRVLPVFLLSDMVPDAPDTPGGSIAFENGLLVAGSSECVVALHSSSHGMVSTDHLLDSVNDELGLDPR